MNERVGIGRIESTSRALVRQRAMLHGAVIPFQAVSYGDGGGVGVGDGKTHRVGRGIRGKVRAIAARVSEVAPGSQFGILRKDCGAIQAKCASRFGATRPALAAMQTPQGNRSEFTYGGKRFAGVEERAGHSRAGTEGPCLKLHS